MTEILEHLREIVEYFSGESLLDGGNYGSFETKSAQKIPLAKESQAEAAAAFASRQEETAAPRQAAQALLERTRQRTLVPTARQSQRYGIGAGMTGNAALLPLIPSQATAMEDLAAFDHGDFVEQLTPETLSRAFARDARRYDN